MARNDDHRITGNSKKVGAAWYDKRNREWQTFTCGVTAHQACMYQINKPTGRKKVY